MNNIKNPLIFVVEDNVIYNDLITGTLKSKKFTNLRTFKSPEECFRNISLNPDVIVLNYAYTGFTGYDLMNKVHETKPWVNFIFLSGQNDIVTAVKIMRQGAFDYIVKNEKAPENLISAIHLAIDTDRKKKQKTGLKKGIILFFILVIVMIILVFSLSVLSDDFNLF
jgi:DNA-binding NtrC family response regulator